MSHPQGDALVTAETVFPSEPCSGVLESMHPFSCQRHGERLTQGQAKTVQGSSAMDPKVATSLHHAYAPFCVSTSAGLAHLDGQQICSAASMPCDKH